MAGDLVHLLDEGQLPALRAGDYRPRYRDRSGPAVHPGTREAQPPPDLRQVAPGRAALHRSDLRGDRRLLRRDPVLLRRSRDRCVARGDAGLPGRREPMEHARQRLRAPAHRRLSPVLPGALRPPSGDSRRLPRRVPGPTANSTPNGITATAGASGRARMALLDPLQLCAEMKHERLSDRRHAQCVADDIAPQGEVALEGGHLLGRSGTGDSARTQADVLAVERPLGHLDDARRVGYDRLDPTGPGNAPVPALAVEWPAVLRVAGALGIGQEGLAHVAEGDRLLVVEGLDRRVFAVARSRPGANQA